MKDSGKKIGHGALPETRGVSLAGPSLPRLLAGVILESYEINGARKVQNVVVYSTRDLTPENEGIIPKKKSQLYEN